MELTYFHSPLLVLGILLVYIPHIVCSISPQPPASNVLPNINPIDKPQPKLGSGTDVTTKPPQETSEMPTATFSEPSTGKDDSVPMDIVQGITDASPANTTNGDQVTSATDTTAAVIPVVTTETSSKTTNTVDSTPMSSETTIPKAETTNPTTNTLVSSSMSSSVTASSDSTDTNGTGQVTSGLTSKQSTQVVTQPITEAVTSGLSTPETTSKSNGGGGKGDKNTGMCTANETMFGKYGMEAFIGAFGLCIVLMVIIIILIFKYTQRGNIQHADDEKNVPKLKLLELRKTETRAGEGRAKTDSDETRDGLQTYSLDYEKHVQEKIDEHKRKTRAPSNTSSAAVSSFMVGKKPSLIATRSLQSPASPTSPGSQKPLLSDDDEPVVFNFIKTPGESLQAGNRRTSNLEPGERRKSNASTGKGKKTPEQSKEFFTADI